MYLHFLCPWLHQEHLQPKTHSYKHRQFETPKFLSHRKYCPQNVHILTICILTYTSWCLSKSGLPSQTHLVHNRLCHGKDTVRQSSFSLLCEDWGLSVENRHSPQCRKCFRNKHQTWASSSQRFVFSTVKLKLDFWIFGFLSLISVLQHYSF